MHKLVGAGLGLVLTAGVAMAQAPAGNPPAPSTGDEGMHGQHGMMSHGAGSEGAMSHGMGGGGMMSHEGSCCTMSHGDSGSHHGDSGSHKESGSHGDSGGMMMQGEHHPPKSAVFRFAKGDASVMVKCADEEPMKACADAASALIDKIGALGK